MEKERWEPAGARTDLALELRRDMEGDTVKGVKIKERVDRKNEIKVTHITVENEAGEKALGKPVGNYITLESRKLCANDVDIHKPFVESLSQVLESLSHGAKKLLVIGLGNRAVTPDALGPLVVDHLFITRHLLREGIVKQAKELSAICPGVMAQTGIETSVIIKSLCDEVAPDIVIAVDALAAREPERLNATIQVCDTGITPGSGVGNHRVSLNRDTLGVPVLAIGVPTVISVPAILHQALEGLLGLMQEQNRPCAVSDEEADVLCQSLLSRELSSMFVTPKNIDESINRVSYTISEAINRFLL